MAAGGLQRPNNPAPVSGPGALSARTDGGPAQAMKDLPNARYGENSAFRDIESGAPMAAGPAPSGGSGGGSVAQAGPPSDGGGMQPPVSLDSGTMMPDQPVTHGAALGPGDTSLALPQGSTYPTVAARLQALAASSGNADIQFLAGLAGGGHF